MNKKSVIIDTIFVFFLSLIILLASFLTSFYISTNEAKSNLVTYGNEIALIYDEESKNEEIKTKYGNIIDIRITILNYSDGSPVLDINPLENALSNEDRYKELNNNLYSFYEKKSQTTGYNTLYYVTKNDNYFIRIGLPISEIRDISLNILLYGSISLVVLNILYGSIRLYLYKKDLNSLKTSLNDLESVIKIPSINKNDDGIEIINESIKQIKIDFQNKISELEIQKNQNNFILDSIEEGFIVLNEKKEVSLINRFALNILNLKKEEIINKNYVFLTLGNELNEKITSLNDSEIKTFDLKIKENIYLFILSKVNFINKAKSNSIAITFFDVTSLRLNEKMKKEFFQNASHELKTPLTTIIGYEGLINNGLIEEESELKQANEVILKEAQRMKNVIDDMLVLSSLENEKRENLININAKDTLKDILDSMKFLIQNKNLELKTNISSCTLLIEEKDLDRLLRNLISNAIKYNKDNGEIKITLNEEYFEIKDTGIGISSNELPRIYERFYRVDKGRSRDLGGTGLGLAIVKHIAIKYNYKINVSSKIGIGTTFRVIFNGTKNE